jgi:hypothetical protein
VNGKEGTMANRVTGQSQGRSIRTSTPARPGERLVDGVAAALGRSKGSRAVSRSTAAGGAAVLTAAASAAFRNRDRLMAALHHGDDRPPA